MELFYVQNNIDYYRKTLHGDIILNFKSPTEKEKSENVINLKYIYFGTSAVVNLTSKELEINNNKLIKLKIKDKSNILLSENFPLDLTNNYNNNYSENLKKLINKKKNKEINILFINGFGASIGDIIIGTSALYLYYSYLKTYFKEINFYTFNEHQDACYEILNKNTLIKNILPYPTPIKELYNFDGFIDLGGMISIPEFNDRPMIDFYLKIFGVNYENIPHYLKRTKLFYNLDENLDLKKFIIGFKVNKKPLLLFNTKAGTKIRTIPNVICNIILKKILDTTEYTIITFQDYDIINDRIINFSEFSKSLIDYITIISQMDKILTTDTSTYHISDYFNIPTSVLFTTIEPEYRTKYYPFCKSYKIFNDNSNFIGKHFTETEKDNNELLNIYKNIDFDKIIKELKK